RSDYLAARYFIFLFQGRIAVIGQSGKFALFCDAEPSSHFFQVAAGQKSRVILPIMGGFCRPSIKLISICSDNQFVSRMFLKMKANDTHCKTSLSVISF